MEFCSIQKPLKYMQSNRFSSNQMLRLLVTFLVAPNSSTLWTYISGLMIKTMFSQSYVYFQDNLSEQFISLGQFCYCSQAWAWVYTVFFSATSKLFLHFPKHCWFPALLHCMWMLWFFVVFIASLFLEF